MLKWKGNVYEKLGLSRMTDIEGVTSLCVCVRCVWSVYGRVFAVTSRVLQRYGARSASLETVSTCWYVPGPGHRWLHPLFPTQGVSHASWRFFPSDRSKAPLSRPATVGCNTRNQLDSFSDFLLCWCFFFHFSDCVAMTTVCWYRSSPSSAQCLLTLPTFGLRYKCPLLGIPRNFSKQYQEIFYHQWRFFFYFALVLKPILSLE